LGKCVSIGKFQAAFFDLEKRDSACKFLRLDYLFGLAIRSVFVYHSLCIHTVFEEHEHCAGGRIAASESALNSH
jgi:hypothetical protein